MEVRSTLRYAKISAFKVREVTRAIQGLPVSAALDLVAFSPKKAAGLISKTLKSAVANAENNANLRVDGLVVKEATAGEGPTMKRMMPRARGSGSRILKRTQSHPDHFDGRDRNQDARQEKGRQKGERKEGVRRKPAADRGREGSSAPDVLAKPTSRNQKAKTWDRKLIQSVFVSR